MSKLTATVWVLTIDGDYSVEAHAFGSEAEVHQCLLDNYSDFEGQTLDELMETGLSAKWDQHEVVIIP